MGLKCVGTKLNALIAIMLVLTCIIVTSVSYRAGRSCMGKMPRTLNLGDKPGWADHVKEVLSTEQASFTMTDGNGEAIIVMTRYVPALGWYLVAEANGAELIETAPSALLGDMGGALFAILLAKHLHGKAPGNCGWSYYQKAYSF